MTQANEPRGKKRMKLYALIAFGQSGPFHSVDFPKVWKTKAAAKRYKTECVPVVKWPIYQIVEFEAREAHHGE